MVTFWDNTIFIAISSLPVFFIIFVCSIDCSHAEQEEWIMLIRHDEGEKRLSDLSFHTRTTPRAVVPKLHHSSSFLARLSSHTILTRSSTIFVSTAAVLRCCGCRALWQPHVWEPGETVHQSCSHCSWVTVHNEWRILEHVIIFFNYLSHIIFFPSIKINFKISKTPF